MIVARAPSHGFHTPLPNDVSLPSRKDQSRLKNRRLPTTIRSREDDQSIRFSVRSSKVEVQLFDPSKIPYGKR